MWREKQRKKGDIEIEIWKKDWRGVSLRVFGLCIYNYIWYIMDLDVDVGKLPNHLKLCAMYSGSILSSNSPQRTEIQRAVRFDAVLILSEKIPPAEGIIHK